MWRACLVAAWIVAGGCGDDGGTGGRDAGPGGGTDAGPGGGTDAGPGGGRDAGPGGGRDAGPGGGADLMASILITEQPQIPQASIDVAITAPVSIPSTPGCTVMFVDPDASDPPAMGFDGGEIRISGLRSEMVFQPGPGPAGTSYSPTTGVPDRILMAGATISATGAGGPGFGPFTITLPTPGEVALSQPPTTGHSQSDSSPLQVRWTPSTSEAILVSLTPVADFTFEVESGQWAFCNTTDTGSFDVPAATLQAVNEGGGLFGRSMLVGVTRIRTASMGSPGSNQVTLSATTSTGSIFTLE